MTIAEAWRIFRATYNVQYCLSRKRTNYAAIIMKYKLVIYHDEASRNLAILDKLLLINLIHKFCCDTNLVINNLKKSVFKIASTVLFSNVKMFHQAITYNSTSKVSRCKH